MFKIAISTSLIGMFIMIIMVEKIDFSESSIVSVNESLLEKNVKIKGIVEYKRELTNIAILGIKDDSGSIKVIAYKDEDKIQIFKNDIVEITGFVKKYDNELEIEADLIKKL